MGNLSQQISGYNNGCPIAYADNQRDIFIAYDQMSF